MEPPSLARMDPFVAQLTRLCADHPTRAKWVFVRSHAAGRTIADRLVLGGTDWANLRFVTPLDVAVRMGAPFLVERGVDPSEEGLGPALVMRLLLRQPEAGGYFRPLANQPQMAAALWTTIRELRMAGVGADDLKPGAFESPAKHRELQALLRDYEDYLTSNHRGDTATVFYEALRHPPWCPIQPEDCWLAQPDVIWTPLELQLMAAMPGEHLLAETIRIPDTTVPRRLADAADVAGVTARTPEPAPHPVALFHAGGREAEIEEVFRRVLQGGGGATSAATTTPTRPLTPPLTLDQVEIACASADYPALVWEKAIRHGWPVTMAQGLPVAITRPGRALLAWAEWIEDDFSAGRLRRLLQSGDVRLDDALDLTAGRAARLLVKAGAAWGRETYRLSLGRLARSDRQRADRDDIGEDERKYLEARAGQADALAAWIDALIAGIPAPDAGGAVRLTDVAHAARAFVDRAAARSSALDEVAATALADAIAELDVLDDLRCPMHQALRFVRERIEAVRVGADRPCPGHLFVSSLRDAGLAGRPHLFIVGLEEGRVFPAAFEDPVLLDAERRSTDDALMRSADRVDEAVHAVRTRIATVAADPGVAVTMSYSCRDLREYRQTYASWLMLDAYRANAGNPAAAYKDMHDALGAPVSAVPGDAAIPLDASRWWLRGAVAGGDTAKPPVLARYPGLDAGLAASAARASDAFTEFDGDVPEAGPVLDPCALPSVSATQLEEAAECPFRHFLKRGLGIAAIETGDRDRDVWLDPLMRGSMLHDLYARLMRRCRDAGRAVTVADDQGWLRAEGTALLDERAREMPPPSGEVADRERRAFLDDLDLFVGGESALEAGRVPVGFEVGFGRPLRGGGDGQDDAEPLAREAPVEVDLGDGLRFRIAGRIDRIDRIDQGDRDDRLAGPAYEVIDYKTGSYYAPAWKGHFAGGRRLQHALYGLAVLELLREAGESPVLAGGQYYFPSARGQQERKVIPAASREAIARVLSDLREVIVSGAFVHARDDEACRFCDYGHACGRDAAARAEAKAGDPKLAAFERLAAHD